MIKNIETDYNGLKFRSRLEARWAVFFETLRIKYDYEVEGFQIDNTKYLPDFYLPELKYWIEIKPYLTEENTRKMRVFAEEQCKIQQEHSFFVIGGSISIPKDCLGDGSPEAEVFGYSYDNSYRWCECLDCGLVGLSYDARADRLPCKECDICAMILRGYYDNVDESKYEDKERLKLLTNGICPKHGVAKHNGCKRHSPNLDKDYNGNSNRLVAAYTAARSFRF